MTEGNDRPSDAWLEVGHAEPDPAPSPSPSSSSPSDATAAWLQAEESDPPHSGTRRKVRASERAAPTAAQDAASLAIVSALQRDAPLMAALWPDVRPAELLRSPPPVEAFQARCDFARRAIDAVGRRDAEARAQAELAQRRLADQLTRLSQRGPALDAALADLEAMQATELLDAVRTLFRDQRTLYAGDVARVDAAAVEVGITPARAREILTGAGFALQSVESRPWSPFAQLPGAPATMDHLAAALIAHPAQAIELLRQGSVLEWLRANGASPAVIDRSREARQAAERGASPQLAVHLQTWALGRRELRLGAAVASNPEALASLVRGGSVSLDELATAARDGLLSTWLRLAGWVVAAGAADLVARHEPSGLKRLAWALGEPLYLGAAAITDASSLARAVLAQAPLREALPPLLASGDLVAWMESLPAPRRDDRWLDGLRRAHEDPARRDDALPFWTGVYALTRAPALEVLDRRGDVHAFASVQALTVTVEVASAWDGLKRAWRSGELLAWLATHRPELPLPSFARPPREDEAELNEVLWALGHRGLVLEWGDHDLAISAPTDLVRAYRDDWRSLEALLSRGHVSAWISRFHGDRMLVPRDREGAGLSVAEAMEALRLELPRLPSGFAALKVALLCGLRALPTDPCRPGDDATVEGFVDVSMKPDGDARAWDPLRAHVLHGTALLWVALDPRVRRPVTRSLLHAAFAAWNPGADQVEHTERVMGGLARSFGRPVPSAALQARLAQTADDGRRSIEMTRQLVDARRGRRRLGALAGVFFVALCAMAVLLLRPAAGVGAQDAGADGDALVRLRVEVTIPRAQRNHPWDLDGSGPELHLALQTRDGPVEVGPCVAGQECAQTFDNVRLAANAPFQMLVDEDDPLRRELLGRIWLRWQGGRQETLRSVVGPCVVTVEVRRVLQLPTPAAAAAPAAATPVPTAAPRADAGAPATRRSSRSPRRTSAAPR
ncbi:MAG: hypothetical protein Q8S73_34165 [Deltaproteobacteria bacterium]|nr:hypothetical protein [Myxococcales bacterium]MDP3219194.1 hypothetical protein [Deltaproteobacteria bacterium]